MALNAAQKRSFRDHGYLQIPAVVARPRVDTALHAINRSLGEGIPRERIAELRSASFCPELQRVPPITDLLLDTPAWALAESLIGSGRIRPVRGSQIALVFPSAADEAPALRPHLDGRHTTTNGVPRGEVQSFTLLVGVLLSDVAGPQSGNFTVWPGSHHLYERYFREHGPQSLLAGMPPVDLAEPAQLSGKAGDVVLAHYALAHCAAPNLSPHVRYAVFFRLKHVEHDSERGRSMTDLWLEYEGLEPNGVTITTAADA